MRHHTSQAAGFSLVETVVVVSILGGLVGLGISASFQAQRRGQVNAVAIGLAGWLEEVRRSALRGESCEVTINAGSISVGMVVASGTGHPIPESCASRTSLLLPSAAQGASYLIAATRDRDCDGANIADNSYPSVVLTGVVGFSTEISNGAVRYGISLRDPLDPNGATFSNQASSARAHIKRL